MKLKIQLLKWRREEMLESNNHLWSRNLVRMSDQALLYNTCLSQADLDSLIEEIRSTSYIDEVESGEQPREESDLWNIIVPVKETLKDTSSLDSLIKHAGNKAAAIVVADDKTKKSVLVIHLVDGAKKDELKVVPKDVIEICSNLIAGNMDLYGVSLFRFVWESSYLLLFLLSYSYSYSYSSSSPCQKEQTFSIQEGKASHGFFKPFFEECCTNEPRVSPLKLIIDQLQEM